MDVTVTMASGEVDEWENVADVIQDNGELVVVASPPGGVPEGAKHITVVIREEEKYPPAQAGHLSIPYKEKVYQTFQVLGVYAAGMWIKVEFPT